jgi:hypothetical protein
MNRRNAVTALAAIIGVLLIACAVIYWVEPAGSLPALFPGHDAGSSHHHVTHGIAAAILGVLLLILAWFRTGPGWNAPSDAG